MVSSPGAWLGPEVLDWIAAEAKKSTYLGSELILAESPLPFSRSLVLEVVSSLKTSTGTRNCDSALEKWIDAIPVERTREVRREVSASPDDPDSWSRK